MERDTNLRELIKTIVLSSAYQLSSRYPGEWKADYVPYLHVTIRDGYGRKRSTMRSSKRLAPCLLIRIR